jgi:hypothetical protein
MQATESLAGNKTRRQAQSSQQPKQIATLQTLKLQNTRNSESQSTRALPTNTVSTYQQQDNKKYNNNIINNHIMLPFPPVTTPLRRRAFDMSTSSPAWTPTDIQSPSTKPVSAFSSPFGDLHRMAVERTRARKKNTPNNKPPIKCFREHKAQRHAKSFSPAVITNPHEDDDLFDGNLFAEYENISSFNFENDTTQHRGCSVTTPDDKRIHTVNFDNDSRGRAGSDAKKLDFDTHSVFDHNIYPFPSIDHAPFITEPINLDLSGDGFIFEETNLNTNDKYTRNDHEEILLERDSVHFETFPVFESNEKENSQCDDVELRRARSKNENNANININHDIINNNGSQFGVVPTSKHIIEPLRLFIPLDDRRCNGHANEHISAPPKRPRGKLLSQGPISAKPKPTTPASQPKPKRKRVSKTKAKAQTMTRTTERTKKSTTTTTRHKSKRASQSKKTTLAKTTPTIKSTGNKSLDFFGTLDSKAIEKLTNQARTQGYITDTFPITHQDWNGKDALLEPLSIDTARDQHQNSSYNKRIGELIDELSVPTDVEIRAMNATKFSEEVTGEEDTTVMMDEWEQGPVPLLSNTEDAVVALGCNDPDEDDQFVPVWMHVLHIVYRNHTQRCRAVCGCNSKIASAGACLKHGGGRRCRARDCAAGARAGLHVCKFHAKHGLEAKNPKY